MGYYLEKLREMKRKESPTSVEGISPPENDTTPRIETNTKEPVVLISHNSLISHPEVRITESGYLTKLRRLKQGEPVNNPNYVEGVPPNSEDESEVPDSSRAADCEISERCEISPEANLNCAQETGVVGELPKNLIYVVDTPTLEQVLPQISQAKLLAFDLETYSSDPNKYPKGGLDPHIGSIRLINLAIDDPDADTIEGGTKAFIIDCIACPSWTELLQPVFSNPQIIKIAHNAKFDVKFLMKEGIEVEHIFDTMLAAQILDSGVNNEVKGHLTLATVAKRYVGEKLDKSEQASDWGVGQLSLKQLTYAAHDATVLLPIFRKLNKILKDAALDDVVQLEMACLPCIASMELTGVRINSEEWMELYDKALLGMVDLEDEIRSMIANSLDPDSSLGLEINLNSHQQLKAALGALGIEIDNTKKETLLAVQETHPIIPKILAYREANKSVSTYGAGFLNHLHPITGRIHASFRQIGADTGRMSCSQPNLQNIPRKSSYRACFHSGEGKVMVKADLSQVELCVAAELSGDDKMIDAIRGGDDLHRLTASSLFEKPPEEVTEYERAFGKGVNFGTLFGQGRQGLIEQASQFGLILSDKQAKEFLDRFAKAWPQLVDWRRRQMRSNKSEIRTLSGRRRVMTRNDSGTKRANTPVQGLAADVFKRGMGLLWEERRKFPSAVLVLAVHDELVVECDQEDGPAVAEWISEGMRKGAEEYVKRVPVRVDAKSADTWAG